MATSLTSVWYNHRPSTNTHKKIVCLTKTSSWRTSLTLYWMSEPVNVCRCWTLHRWSRMCSCCLSSLIRSHMNVDILFMGSLICNDLELFSWFSSGEDKSLMLQHRSDICGVSNPVQQVLCSVMKLEQIGTSSESNFTWQDGKNKSKCSVKLHVFWFQLYINSQKLFLPRLFKVAKGEFGLDLSFKPSWSVVRTGGGGNIPFSLPKSTWALNRVHFKSQFCDYIYVKCKKNKKHVIKSLIFCLVSWDANRDLWICNRKGST